MKIPKPYVEGQTIQWPQEKEQTIIHNYRDDFFNNLTDFIIFVWTQIQKVAGYGQSKSKMIFLKKGVDVDGFNYFSMIVSYFIL